MTYGTIYPTRYQAQKVRREMREDLKIVKVDAGNGTHGYKLMTHQDYRVWRKQR